MGRPRFTHLSSSCYDRRPGAARPGRADHRELRSPSLPAGATGVAPQVASTRVPVPLTLQRSRSIHTTPRPLSAHSYRVAPADHPVAVPEKYGSAGNERPKTRFLANNFGNGGPMLGPLCRIMSNYTTDIFTMDLARYSYR